MPYKNVEDQRAAAKRHYLKNRQAMMDRAMAGKAVARIRNKEFLRSYLETHPCVSCGESDPIVLEFDHIVRADKSFNISDGSKDCLSIKSLEEEIAKCQVLCANCHRRKTFEENRVLRDISAAD